MTNVSTGSRVSRLRWVLGVVAVLAVVAGVFFWRTSGHDAGGQVGGYAVPLDPASRVRSGLFSEELKMPQAFAVGRTLSVSDGSRVRLIHVDGRSEDVAGPGKVTMPSREMRGEAIDNFLAVPLAELANLAPLGTSATGGDVRIVSPVGVTRFSNPPVVWSARPETNYDVAIVDPADPMAPPRVAEKVRPPVAFTDLKSPQKRGLQADRLYDVYVRESDNVTVLGAARILVAKTGAEGSLPEAPADLLREAVEAMAKRPTRTGDAWLALSRLPADWSESELGVRLRLRVALELGRADLFARAQEDAWRLVKN